MARAYRIRKGTKPEEASTSRPTGMTAPKKLMLLFTIVNRSKAEFYADVLQKFEISRSSFGITGKITFSIMSLRIVLLSISALC